jgi:protein phosphatase 1 regulatory subunit 7
LTKIENLHSLTLLEELYLSENGFTEIEGLDRNVEISTLDLANNKIRSISDLQHLSKLEELWVRICLVGHHVHGSVHHHS